MTPPNARLTIRPINLQDLLSSAQLPALPQSAIRILELSRDPENGPAEFAVPIEADPGLAGQVLRFVNSSYFGFPREIASVKLAITLVGMRTIKNFSLWSAVFGLMPNPKHGSFDLKKLWQDSLRRAVFARNVGSLLGLRDAEGPFAAALLQDLAVPLLAKELGSRYLSLIEERQRGKRQLSRLERDQFGWTHAEAGGVIARRWNLPEEFAQLVERHADGAALLDDPAASPEQIAVALSAQLPSSADEAWEECAALETVYDRLRGNRGVPLGEFLATIDEQSAEFAPVLKLNKPGKSLVEYYHGATASAQ